MRSDVREEQCAEILAALDALGDIQAELVDLSMRRDERRRQDLIAQRRALAVHTAKVGERVDALLGDIGDEALMADFRRLFSVLRAKSATHQANWSAVRVGERETEYLTSAREAGAAYRALIDWLRATIADIIKR